MTAFGGKDSSSGRGSYQCGSKFSSPSVFATDDEASSPRPLSSSSSSSSSGSTSSASSAARSLMFHSFTPFA